MLSGSSLVMFCFGKHADFPQLFIQLCHKSLDPGFDCAEEMITQLLSFGSRGSEKCASRKNQVAAFVIKLFLDQKILLLGTDCGHHAGSIQTAEQTENADCLPVQRFHGPKQRSLFIQRFSAVGTVSCRNAENVFLDKGIGGRIPGSITASLESGAQAAAGQGGCVRFAADQFFPGELLDDFTTLYRSNKSVMFFSCDGIQRLEPVRIMCGTAFQSPVLHGVCNNACNLGIKTAALINGLMQGFVGFLGETLAHHGIIEYIDTEILFDKRHWNPTFHHHKYMSV